MGALLLIASGGEAHADEAAKKACRAAYDQTQALRDEHKLIEARAHAVTCEASCTAAVSKECTQWKADIDADLPTVVFAARDASGADKLAVRVSVDGQVLGDTLDGKAVPINPGKHVVRFETAGAEAVEQEVLIRQGEKNRKISVVLGPPKTSSPSGPSSLGTQKILALVAGSLGVVGLGVGTAFGIMAILKKSEAESACPATLCLTQDGVNKWSDAVTTGNVSTAGFIVGGVWGAGAIVLWATAPRSAPLSVEVGLGVGSLQVKGTW